MDIDNDAARYLECGSNRGQILREPGHGALEGRCKNTTVRAEDPGKGDHLRWRQERPDSDHATCLDTRRSISVGAVLLGGGAVNLFSRAQATTAEGTSEAEYVAISEIVKGVPFLCQVQAFVMSALESNPVVIVEDNQGVIKMANNSHSSKRTRHIDIKHHLIRFAVDEGKVRVTYVKTEHQYADVLTKPLDRRAFEKHVNALMKVG